MSVSKKSAVCLILMFFQLSKHYDVVKQFYYEMTAFFFLNPDNSVFYMVLLSVYDSVLGFVFRGELP